MSEFLEPMVGERVALPPNRLEVENGDRRVSYDFAEAVDKDALAMFEACARLVVFGAEALP